MQSEERLSTGDIAGGGDTGADRDRTSADSPPADAAAVPPKRVDRDDAGGAADARAGDRPAPAAAAAAGPDGDAAPPLADADGFQARLEEIQVRFVDEPRGAVED